MTTSLVSITFPKVCLVVLPLTHLAGEKIKIGGFAEKALKKLKGLKLRLPSLSSVLAKAIGLGATAPKMYLCTREVFSVFGSIVSIFYIFFFNANKECVSFSKTILFLILPNPSISISITSPSFNQTGS